MAVRTRLRVQRPVSLGSDYAEDDDDRKVRKQNRLYSLSCTGAKKTRVAGSLGASGSRENYLCPNADCQGLGRLPSVSVSLLLSDADALLVSV